MRSNRGKVGTKVTEPYLNAASDSRFLTRTHTTSSVCLQLATRCSVVCVVQQIYRHGLDVSGTILQFESEPEHVRSVETALIRTARGRRNRRWKQKELAKEKDDGGETRRGPTIQSIEIRTKLSKVMKENRLVCRTQVNRAGTSPILSPKPCWSAQKG